MNNYPRDNKNDIILPTLIAIIAVLSIYFYLQLTYSTSLTIFPSINNIKIKQLEYTKQITFLVQPLWKIVWSFLKRLKIELPYDPAIPLLGMYPDKTIFQKDTCTPRFIAALFTIAKTWKQPKCPLTDEWIKEMWYIYTMRYYSAMKRMK